MDKRAIRSSLKKIPVISRIARLFYRQIFKRVIPFETSQQYWEARYASEGDSGDGSYGRLASFKADVLNEFLASNGIQSVAEFGCGDGAQLELMVCPNYTGIDVSKTILERCVVKFSEDASKRFLHVSDSELNSLSVDLVLSLDVVYHLVEDTVFNKYMHSLFDTAKTWVVIYSSNFDGDIVLPHVRHRKFSSWIEKEQPDWTLYKIINQKYPFVAGNEEKTSLADFYFFKRK